MIKLGSRQSLLAQAQVKILSHLLVDYCTFEYLPLSSRGDVKKDSLPGLYTSTLDEALQNSSIDIALHCLKDVPIERPFFLKEVFRIHRQFPQDIFLFNNHIINNKIIVGTHSERRKAQLSKLKDFLPISLQSYSLESSYLSGNLQTRLEKLQKKEYSGIILSLEGLERFFNHGTDSQKKLLQNLQFMILPLKFFPTSPGQGDLTVEALSDFKAPFPLKKNTQTDKERFILQSLGGGCSSPIGITCLETKDYFLTYSFINSQYAFQYERKRPIPHQLLKQEAFLGMFSPEGIEYDIRTLFKNKTITIDKNTLAFITSRRALQKCNFAIAAGLSTWKLLANQDTWVYCCHENLGEEYLLPFKQLNCLQYINPQWKNPWQVFSHKDSFSDLGYIEECYEKDFNDIPLSKNINFFYWTSYSQYKNYVHYYPWIKEKVHFCGLGKSYTQLSKENIEIYSLTGYEEYVTLLQ
jgi:hydroxymethylbilane synthase